MLNNWVIDSLPDKDFIGPIINYSELDVKAEILLIWVQERFSLSNKEMVAIHKLTKRLLEKDSNSKNAWTKSLISTFHYIFWKIIKSDSLLDGWGTQKESDEEVIKWLWLDDLKYNKNPIVIYKWGTPLYWNKAMEKLTW